MNTPTPRTDAEITFTGTYTCTHHNDAERTACPVCLVTALTAERDQLRAALALGQENCDAVYDELRGDCDELRGDVVRLTSERDQLRAENATLRAAQKACEACDEPTAFEVRQLRAELGAEREKAERYRLVTLRQDAELAEMHTSFAGNVHLDNIRLRAEVERWQTVAATMSEEREHNANEASRLRAEVERLTVACDKFSNFEIEQGDWKARAERAEAAETVALANWNGVLERAMKAEAELATERARLDWVFRNCKVTADDYAIHDREDLGAAMKEDAK
jgi:hypothetical protein